MPDNLSDNRLVRNEQLIRFKNIKIITAITKYFHNDENVKIAPLAFTCECSDLSCGKHVKTSIDTYQKTHQRKDRFMISKGHETPSIEKIVSKESNYEVVEKEALKP